MSLTAESRNATAIPQNKRPYFFYPKVAPRGAKAKQRTMRLERLDGNQRLESLSCLILPSETVTTKEAPNLDERLSASFLPDGGGIGGQ